jgi:hypothetical protein
MRVVYHTNVGGYHFDVCVSIHKDEIVFEAVPHTTPELGGWNLHLPKTRPTVKVLNEYSNWMVKVVSKLTDEIVKGHCIAIPALDETRVESCDRCAFWGFPGDSNPTERVCRYWDIPERECITGNAEYCSRGYAPKDDDLLDVFEHSSTLRKTYCTIDPERHTFLDDYIREMQNAFSPERIGKFIENANDSLKPYIDDLTTLLDIPKEK